MKIFNLLKLNKAYVSPIDLFQAAFDKKHPKSASQQAEVNKHQKIFLKRDKKIISF